MLHELIAMTSHHPSFDKHEPFAHTYSIIARDDRTKEIGAAVQSHWFSVGTVVPWVLAGVGAVVTQSFTNPTFGPQGLTLMAEGIHPKEAAERMLATDEGRDLRQLALIDRHGEAFAYTGRRCVAEAGHRFGKDFSVQANMMLKDTVWDAMADSFLSSEGPLAERLLVALNAAENQGGDARGRQSAALVVVKGEGTGDVWRDRTVDLRVDDHREPLKEIGRLLRVHRAYESMNAGDEAMEHDDMDGALMHYSQAERLLPRNEEMIFWHAVALANKDRFDESLPLFIKAFRRDPNWRLLVDRLMASGMLRLSSEQRTSLLRAEIKK